MIKDFVQRHKWELLVALVAVAVRLVYLLEIASLPGFEFPMVDEKWHWEWAQQILHESFWGEGSFFRAPLYPYFLALLAAITGSSIFWVKFLQILLTAGTAVFIYRLADHLFGRGTALLAGLLYGLYGTLLFYETMFLIPVLFLMLLCWGMYRLVVFQDSTRVATWIVTGLLFGLAAISRPNILLVIPILMLWIYWLTRSDSFSARAKRPLLLLAGVIIAIAPVTVRNLAATGEFILISSQGGINLYLGNNEQADGLTMIMPEVDLDESVSWREFGTVTRAAAQEEAGRDLSDAEESSFWSGKALDFIVSNPGEFASLIGHKMLYLINGFENSDNGDIYYQRNRSTLYSLLVWKGGILFPFGLLLPLAVVGVFLRRDRWRALIPVYIFVLAYIPSIVLFLVTARHRLPLVPLLMIFAAAGLIYAIGHWRRMALKEQVMAVLILAASLIICNRDWLGEQAVSGTFQIHMTAGIQYEQMGDFEKAENEYLTADAAYPYSPTLINNLAHTQYRLGKLEIAEENFHRALALDPEYARAYNNLGLVMRDVGREDSALTLFRTALDKTDVTRVEPDELGQIWLNIATAWDYDRQLDSAAAAYTQAMAAAPEMVKAYTQAAAFYGRHQGYRKSDSLYLEAKDRSDLTGADFFNWGLTLIGGERHRHGISMMERALHLDPEIFQANYCIAMAHHRLGSPVDSVRFYLDQCLEVAPDYSPAVELRRSLSAEN